MEKRSSSVFRIDEQVFYTMGAIALICLVIVGFRYKSLKPCNGSDIKIKALSGSFYPRSTISFTAEVKHGTTYKWYFGDDSEADISGPNVRHGYSRPGKFTVTLIVDGACEQVMEVIINDAPLLKAPRLQPDIVFSDTADVNIPVEFIDLTPDATSWEWRFGNGKSVDITQKTSFTFTRPGEQKVFLKINGSNDRYISTTIFIRDTKPILAPAPAVDRGRRSLPPIPLVIKDKPDGLPSGTPPVAVQVETKVEEVKAVYDIQPGELQEDLKQVVKGSKTAADFSKYFCEGEDIGVVYNGKKMKFSEMCKDLKDINKIKKLSVNKLAKNNVTKCIKEMDVTAVKKILGFL